MMTSPNNTSGRSTPLLLTVILSGLAAIALLGVSLFLYPGWDIYAGIMTGWLLGVLNYGLLTKIVQKLTDPTDGKKTGLVLLLVLKMFLLLGIVWLSFWLLRVHVLAFLAGFMCLILIVLIQNLVRSVSTTK